MKELPQLTVGGIFLTVVGLVLLLLGIQFSALSFCLGETVFGYCVGSEVNFTWILWLAVLVVGLLTVVFSLRRGR